MKYGEFRTRYVYLVNRFGAFWPFLLSLVLLMIVFYLTIVGFMIIEGWNLSDAFYMAVITLSTVGFTEVQPLSVNGRLFVAVVISLGVSVFMFVIASFTQLLMEGEVYKFIGRHRVRKTIEKLSGHYIVCGYGRIGQVVTREIRSEGHPVVIVENNPDELIKADQQGELFVKGDATDDEILQFAGVDRAAAVITALSNDASNVFVVLTARQLNPDAYIVARTDTEKHASRLERAGADRVIMPHHIGGQRMAQTVLRPTVTSFIELSQSDNIELQLEEISISPGSGLVKQDIASSGIRSKFNIIVVGIKRESGALVFNPSASDVIHAGDTLLVVGEVSKLQEFRELA